MRHGKILVRMHDAVEPLFIVMHCSSRTHKLQRSGHGPESAHLVPLPPRALRAAPQMKEIDGATLAFQQKVGRGLVKALGWSSVTASVSCSCLWCRS